MYIHYHLFSHFKNKARHPMLDLIIRQFTQVTNYLACCLLPLFAPIFKKFEAVLGIVLGFLGIALSLASSTSLSVFGRAYLLVVLVVAAE